MIDDPIVNEVRQARKAYAAKFNDDLDAIVRDLKEQEQKSGRRFVPPPATAGEAAAARVIERCPAAPVP